MANAITPEEYETWEPFAAAYQRIAKEFGYEDARDELRTRLANDDLRAAARRASQPVRGGKLEVVEFVNVVASMWDEVVTDFDNIWRTSTHTFKLDVGRYPPVELTCTGIRIEPAGLEQILVDAGHSPAPSATTDTPAPELAEPVLATTAGLPDLPQAALEQWGTLFAAHNPGASEAAARAAVVAMFPSNHVTRDRLRRVLPPRPPGRPKTSRDK